MGLEIERKFLLKDDGWRPGPPGISLRQGFLLNSDECTIRVRAMGTQAFITIKGRTQGPVRLEYEYPIPVEDADELLVHFCQSPLIEKNRYIREYHGQKWEVDEFSGVNQGLIVAELELHSPDQEIRFPPWIGLEVTDDPRYLNANLAKRPFTTWGTAP